MFNVGDYVVNQRTGHLGQVIGYGHQILDVGYMPTVKVLVAESTTSKKRGFVEEDLYAVWVQWLGAQQNH